MDVTINIETGTRLIKIPVSINGNGPFSFNFDTGASTTTLSTGLAEKLGIHTYESNKPNARGVGGGIPTKFAKARVNIGSLRFDEDELFLNRLIANCCR